MAIVETPGICIRTADCQVARLGRGVKIPLGARFVCPGCGHALAPPAQLGVLASRRASMNPVPLIIFAGAGLAVLGGSILLGWQLGAVRSAHAAPTPTSVPAAKHAEAASAPAPVSLAVLHPETGTAQPVHPPLRPATPAPDMVAHALPVAQTATMQTAMARMRVPSTAPTEPAGLDRPFSTQTLVGGTPVFPASYNPHRSGRVTVSCMIGTDGSPSGCLTVWEQGGNLFATAVQAWLNSGQVKFQPALRQGRPEARRESWTVVFN